MRNTLTWWTGVPEQSRVANMHPILSIQLENSVVRVHRQPEDGSAMLDIKESSPILWTWFLITLRDGTACSCSTSCCCRPATGRVGQVDYVYLHCSLR